MKLTAKKLTVLLVSELLFMDVPQYCFAQDGEVDDWKDIADYIEMKINNAFIAAQRKRVVDG